MRVQERGKCFVARCGSEVTGGLAGFVFEPIGNTPEEFGTFVKEDIARWAKLVKENGAEVEQP